ncbi:malate:quinone oxidoreductase [Mycolicibacterium phlei]|uniref:malate dehydrogenase (quinone) n=2 Tax=Mycolicibacterium phlei TaxID=1771 RepID=UPI00031CD2A0|nr:malate dehydrogenase (quinone) [Mycolicibacterium phlei]AMO62018.1 putative malate:quinone oxidoreductase [Mycolicibacterium phlei]KXW75816.1 malate:quinone oxidoreductase [Mycolicibacterium phlei DSM 43071]STZ19776.1 malate:quinone oxidoreductase [Mycolicibacterium phlei]VEG10123.1 malate:quinone oxidoreductase [Mycobacteroides chelonae]
MSVAKTDVVLIGAGIMSATLGALLKQLEPNWSITLIERLDGAAAESSDPWNNAGTGHSALCELNYTPQNADGSVDISKAIKVNEQFQISRQFWAYAVENGLVGDPRSFLNPVPHASYVRGADNVAYLRRRYDALAGNPLFGGMEFIDDEAEFARRLPLMAEGRDFREPVALSWAPQGTDVNFGSLSRQLIGYVAQQGMTTRFGHEVRDLDRNSDGTWTVKAVNLRTGRATKINTRFVFVGAGGGALILLQKAGLQEAKGFGGFPVSGKFLRTDVPALTGAHKAKVYGQPPVDAPPMSVPHLDARVINGKPWLMFGPFAGWSPKFLKHGDVLDLPESVTLNNLPYMANVGLTQFSLVKYLVGQLMLSDSDRVESLREFAPTAKESDWEVCVAGQRVQVISGSNGKGSLDFGTTVVTGADGTMAGLLGASPGASTAVTAMLDVLERCFPSRYVTWLPKIRDMVPSLGHELSNEPALFDEIWSHGSKVLRLDEPAAVAVQ